MDFLQTIRNPWERPVDYFTLALSLVIFAIVAFVLYDTLRILIRWSAEKAASVAS